ncbi:FAD-dependent monooxygenase yanF [Diaporthe amygdali]|uniref:FAD-dependent monooxygenase yanF n=1 Tax=Phomopsis amygdali TaxID=1214568 RepID=UPI0022FDB106|nr:FAD-dependent monooxygenase yanF [Diaporthe amygdali]KAJ0119661.1 FAD-dependent monooxygenase yanF [Diaporthe amygdali]
MKFTLCQAILALLVPAALSIDIVGGHSPKCVCCSALSKDPELKSKVLVPDTEIYDKRLQSYYSANAAQAAWCMVLPENTLNVSRIAKVISKHQCPFGIRSGAHSAFKGSNGAKDGITVDFGYMNKTTYNNVTNIASIDPGSTWERVYTTLRDDWHVTTVGGRASVVGVGGFVTGGGYSFHTNAHGFACDTVTNFEIVLANGTVVNANSTSNPDLYKAQKGGSGNLGFVTRIDQKVINSTDMWGGLTVYNLTERDKLFRAYINFSKKMDQDPASQNIVGMYWGTHRGYGLRGILTNSDAVSNAPAFDEYKTIANISSTSRVAAVAEMVPEFTGPTPLGLYANWFVGEFQDDFRMMTFVDDNLRIYGEELDKIAQDMEQETGQNVTYDVLAQFQPFTQSMVKHSQTNGGNILGLEDVVADGPTTNWLIVLTCDTTELQDRMLPLAQEFRKEIDAYAKEIGVYKDWRYLNYAWVDQNPIASYGEKNVAFLKAVAKRVDPDGVFQKLRITGFKIPV